METQEYKQYERNCSRKDGVPVLGLMLIAVGSVFLLNKLGYLDAYWRNILISWQAVVIFIGLLNTLRSGSRVPGVIMILVGGIFLAPKVIDIPFETRQLLWPALMIVVGLLIVFKTRSVRSPKMFKPKLHATIDDGMLDEVAIFGGGKKIITNKNLKGGAITAIFGGLELDFSEADFVDDVTVIEVTTIFGGVSMMVKSEWDVQVQVNSILGGFSDERRIYKGDGQTNAKKLIIKGTAILGGGEVKSY